jgi:hypothetical protein
MHAGFGVGSTVNAWGSVSVRPSAAVICTSAVPGGKACGAGLAGRPVTGVERRQVFDLLRRASQRSNMPVRELAGQIVKDAQQRRALDYIREQRARSGALAGRLAEPGRVARVKWAQRLRRW